MIWGGNPLFSETSTCTSWDLWTVFPPVGLSGMISPCLAVGELSIAAKRPWRWSVSNCTTLTYLDIQTDTETEKIWLDPPQNPPILSYFTPNLRRYDWMSIGLGPTFPWWTFCSFPDASNVTVSPRCSQIALTQDAVAIWTRCWGGTTHKPWRVFSISCVNHQGSSIEIYGSFERFPWKEPGALFELAIFLAPDHQLLEWISSQGEKFHWLTSLHHGIQP